jgi:hypothetical protein
MVAGPQKVSVLLVSEGSKGAARHGCDGHPRHAWDSTELSVFNHRQQNLGCQEEMKHTAVGTVSCHFAFLSIRDARNLIHVCIDF